MHDNYTQNALYGKCNTSNMVISQQILLKEINTNTMHLI